MNEQKQTTRPAVICACGKILVFADERYTKMSNTICHLCGRNIWRDKKGEPPKYRDKLGNIHDLKIIEVIVK